MARELSEQQIQAILGQALGREGQFGMNAQERADSQGYQAIPGADASAAWARQWGTQSADSTYSADPIAAIIQRIARLKSVSPGEASPLYGSPFYSQKRRQNRTEADMLEEYLKSQQQGQGSQGMRPQPIAPRGSSIKEPIFDMRYDMANPPVDTAIMDPYRETRNQAKLAAQRYLEMINPHLVSSLSGTGPRITQRSR